MIFINLHVWFLLLFALLSLVCLDVIGGAIGQFFRDRMSESDPSGLV